MLLVGIVMAAVGMIAMVGASTINSSQDQVEYERAKLAMGELADSAKATGGGVNGSVDFGPQAASKLSIDESAGTFNVTNVYENGSVNEATTNGKTTRTLGKVVYQQGNREVAMQGGGVFVKSSDSDASVFDQRPAVSYRSNVGQYPTLSMSVIQVRGETRSGNVRLSGGTNMSNMLEDAELPGGSTLKINVTSEYYQAWGAVFNESAGIPEDHITYHDAAKTVEIDLTIQRPQYTPVSGAIVSPTGGLNGNFDGDNIVGAYPDDMDGNPTVVIGPDPTKGHGYISSGVIKGNLRVNGSLQIGNPFEVKNETYVDGYLSDGGGATFNETVYVSGNISEIQSDSTMFEQDLVVGGDLSMGDDITESELKGDLYVHGDTNGNLGPNVTNLGDAKGVKTPPTDPEDANSGRHFVEKYSHIKDPANNNNSDNCLDASGEWVASSSCTLDAGDYYMHESNMIDDDILLNTSNGSINIYIENKDSKTIKFKNNIKHIDGDSPVHIYYDASTATGNKGINFMKPTHHPESFVGTISRDARLFKLYVNGSGESNADIRFNNHNNFTGLLYGLGGGDANPANVEIGDDTVINGAVLGKVTKYDSDTELHYDRRLGDLGFGTRDASSGSIPKGEVRYVYISDVQASA
uniref:DUF7289 family protein n=1 Tax=Halococcoides cellulosivorans TaxID=1679096 RepID=UPI00131F43A5|nr:hypothetical protein [Halococcoides cellulosivorans]